MSTHTWQFFRAGGVDQVQLRTGADLLALDQLDQKLWVALACPVRGVEFDERTLALIDADGDGRIRANELIAAARWAGSMLRDAEELARRSSALPLAAIQASNEEGALLLDTARALLVSIGKADAQAISVEDVGGAVAAFNKRRFNGDGAVPESSAGDDTVGAAIRDVLACTEAPATDRDGSPAITETIVAGFFDAAAEYVGWLDARTLPAASATAADAEAAWSALDAVRSKIDDFFGRTRIAAYDARALDAINREQAEYLAIAARDLHVSADEIGHFPLARVTAEASLPLGRGVNPAWAAAIETFRARVVGPILGDRSVLTASEWGVVCAAFAGYAAWRGARTAHAVEKLGEARLRALLDGGTRATLLDLIAQDQAAEPLAKAIETVEKLVRLNRDLMPLANNFVCFRDFYARASPGIFQLGTLYIDRRACDLCVHVTDAGRHTSMAPHSNAYLLYCDLRSASGETMSIAAAITDGDVDNLMVGRNGVFYDREGKDWDATVTRIVENPISIRQAFWSPYKKLLRMIQDQVARRAAAANEASDARVTAAADTAGAAAAGPPAAPATAGPRRLDIGVVAALGVAVGGITAALGALLQAFFGLGIWMPLGVVGLILIISGPSMAVAYLKLRTRNLGPLLDANGWAINAMARINVPLGRSLTSVAKLPKDAHRDLVDPFAEKKKPWPVYAVIVLLLCGGVLWYLGMLDGALPAAVRSTELLGDAAPAAVRAEAADAPVPEAAATPEGAAAEAPAPASP